MKKLFKNNIKFIVGFVLGAIIFGLVGVYASNVSSGDVTYDNTNSGSEYNTVQSAIDDLYSKVGSNIDITQLYTNHTYNNQRQVSNVVSLSLDAGNYVCFATSGIASDVNRQNHRSAGASKTLTPGGCDSTTDITYYHTGTGGGSAYSGSYYLQLIHNYIIFTCSINTAKSITVTHTNTKLAATPWSGELACLKIN